MEETFEKDFESELEALATLDEYQKEVEQLFQQRNENLHGLAAIRAKNAQIKLKSDLKRSTAFVKKIKALTSEAIGQCQKEVESLNLKLYISEIVTGLLTVTFKAVDVTNIAKLCVSLHHRYDDFLPPLLDGLKNSLINPLEDDADAGKKRRIQIRLVIELYQMGLFNDDQFFFNLLKNLLGKGKSKQVDLSGLSAYVKFGGESLLGFVPPKISAIAAKLERTGVPSRRICDEKVSLSLKEMITDTFNRVSLDLVKAHTDYRKKEIKAEKDRAIHGSLTEEKQAELDYAKRLFEKLLSVTTTLSETIDMPLPVLEMEKDETDKTSKGLTVWDGAGIMGEQDGGVFGDIESRIFYEDLPDLLSSVPLTMLGFTAEQAAALTEKLERDQKRQTELRTGQAAAIPAEEQAGSTAEVVTESEDIVVDLTEESTGTGIEKELDESATAEELTSHAKLMALLTEKLPECMNRQKADEFCVSFCYLNSKSARKKLVQALARIPRNRIELIAPYARITASLARLYPEIVPPIVQSLKKEFHGMLKTKNQLYIDSKIRNVRYQAELVKFGLLPPITIFRMFKDLIVDFSVHNVELIATLLESCGRFLYLIPFTHERMNEILETVMRLKRQKNLNLQQQNILESAFYAVKPVERVKKQSKQYTVMQQYLIHLLQVRMDDPKVSIDDIIKSLRRLPWQNKEENLDYIFIKTVVKIARTKYVSIPNIADCISALSRFYPNLVIRVIDKLLEEVQRGIETPFKREPQRTLGIIRLIGELYNFAVLSSALIFELLYHVINYGHEVSKAVESTSSSTSVGLACVFNPKVFSDIDVPTDLFRAQVVCELLNTCGEYYVRGALREKMNKFLTYFQRYLLTKQFVPLHIEFCILDTMDYLEKLAKDAENTQAKKGSNMSTSLLFTRYDNWEAVQNIIEEWESVKGIAENDEEDDEEEEERRDNTDKEAVDEGGSESESDGSSGSEDESESEEDEEEEERRLAEKEEEDFSELQAAKMLEKMRVQEEDDEFEQAFKSVMQQSVSSVTSKATDVNKMAIPAKLPKAKNTTKAILIGEIDEATADDDGQINSRDNQVKKAIPFTLLSRDTRGRFEARQLLVPKENTIAVKLSLAEEAQRREKEILKQRVLELESLNADNDDEMDMWRAQPTITGSTYTSVLAKNNRKGNWSRGTNSNAIRRIEEHKPSDTLNLDEFLAESSKAEIRKIGVVKKG